MIKLNFSKRIIIIFGVFCFIVGGMALVWYKNKNDNFIIDTYKEGGDASSLVNISNNQVNNSKIDDGNAGVADEGCIYVHVIGEVLSPGLVKLGERGENC